MSELLKLQQQFQAYLMHADQTMSEHMTGRLNIYGDAYRSRLQEALAKNYPILQRYLGCEEFTRLSLLYLDAHPSEYRSIRWFGDQLASFMTKIQFNPHFLFLAELAELEWTMASVFDAADSDIVSLEQMASIPPDAWENMRLTMHPSIRCINLTYNTVSIWRMLNDEVTPPAIEKNASAVTWIIWRKALLSQFAALAVDEASAIDAMMNGATFGEIGEGLCQWIDPEQVGMRAASLLKGWIMAGLISGITL